MDLAENHLGCTLLAVPSEFWVLMPPECGRNSFMEDRESASNRTEVPQTRHEDSKLEQFDAKLGQFSDRFEKN